MFGELPKLFDRNFAMGFFLPVAAFLAATIGLLTDFDLLSVLMPHVEIDILIGTTIIGLASWLGGVILLVLNRSIYMTIEGYGKLNPLRIFARIEKRRYRRLCDTIKKLNKEYKSFESRQEEISSELQAKRIKSMQEYAERFPHGEEWLLPTSFGNTIRAFETYSGAMYGLDDIQGWNRLVAVIPQDYLSQVDTAKSQTDFWVNLFVLSLFLLLEYVGVSLYTLQLRAVWIPLGILVVLWIMYSRARNSVVEWGDMVKSAYDVFLPELRTKLCFPPYTTKEREKELWTAFSQAIIYRLPSALPPRMQSQPPVNSTTESGAKEPTQ